MTRQRIVLLATLGIVTLCALGVVVWSQYAEIRRESRVSRETLREQVAKMRARVLRAEEVVEEIPTLEAELAARRERLYMRAEMDLFSFGLLVRQMLERTDVRVERYYTVEGDTPTLEYSVSGRPEALVDFLAAVDRRPKEIWIASLSVRVSDGRFEGAFRVSYATMD